MIDSSYSEITGEYPPLTLLALPPPQLQQFPRFRYMGSKHRLTEWLHSVFQQLEFETAMDAFSGSGVVSYLLKTMHKQVFTNDSLHFPYVLSQALIQNNSVKLAREDVDYVVSFKAEHTHQQFVQTTFRDIFYTAKDLEFLDDCWVGIRNLKSPLKRSLVLACLLRSCIKRQPRGVFTVSGKGSGYQDGRRDLQLSLQEHFHEQVKSYNLAVFSNGKQNRSFCGDIFDSPVDNVDLVYMDPPYVPRADDNCYMKRYHFLEGLSCYWQGVEIMETSKVKKIKKPYSPFAHRKNALHAFDQLFRRFADSTQVLSYSSNAYPDLDCLVKMMKKYKHNIEVLTKPHRYHFGTHENAKRNQVEEYLIIGAS
ncbi:MAG: DNA adenine methylase [Kiritimatiellia bacterium]